MIRLLLSILLFVMVMLIDFAKADAQAVIRPGLLSVEERSVSDDVNGRSIVPPLNERQGIVRITVARNYYFSIHDVARWIRDGNIVFDRVDMETSNVSVRNDDDSIQMNFNVGFIGSSETVERRLQIRYPEGHFENYFDFIRLYKQKVVNYHIGTVRAPQFAEDFLPTGNLVIESNESEVDIVVFNDRGERISERLLIVPSADGNSYTTEFTNIPVGSYIVRASKDGFPTKTLSNIEVSNRQTVSERIMLSVSDTERTESSSVNEEVVSAPVTTDEVVRDDEINNNTDEEMSDEVFMEVEESPQPVGGMGAFASYVGDNLEYPEVARRAAIQGRVFIRAIVNIDGSLSEISVLRPVGGGLDEEAERIVREYPGWVPGTQGGRPVRSYITLPILFSLN